MKCSICKKKEAEYYLKKGNKVLYFCRTCATKYLITHKDVFFIPRIEEKTIAKVEH
jgi:protein-arginine kinase activator protein McsA